MSRVITRLNLSFSPECCINMNSHAGMKYCVQQLNALYRSTPALYEKQFEPGGFEWIDLNHRSESVIVYMRKGKKEKDNIWCSSERSLSRPFRMGEGWGEGNFHCP